MMRMNLEQTYKAVVLKEMLESELKELELTQESMKNDKTVSKSAIRKLVKRLFVWMPIFMILVNYVRNGIDPFIFIYAPVFLFYTAIYTTVIVALIWMYNTAVKLYQKSRREVVEETNFYEQNKTALRENIQTIDHALRNHSSLIPQYRSKEVMEQLITYKKVGRARTDEEAIEILEKEQPVYNQPAFARPKKRFLLWESLFTKLSRLGRFIGVVVIASLLGKSIARSSYRRGW